MLWPASRLQAKRAVAQKGEAQINVTVPTSNGVKACHYAPSLKAEEMIEMKHLRKDYRHFRRGDRFSL